MPNKCVAFGCTTGYDSSNNVGLDTKTTLHSFPKDQALFDKWVKAISREDFKPSKHSRVCSLHFLPSDFVEKRQDSNVTRKKHQRKAELHKRYLKEDAIPSIFHNVPSYLSENSVKRRTTTKATASSRREHEEIELGLLNASFKVADDISALTLAEIEQRLSSETTRPTGFRTAILDERLIIYLLAMQNSVPVVLAAVTVDSNLTLSLSNNGQLVAASQCKDIVSGKLKTMSQLINVMARVKSWVEEPQSLGADYYIEAALTAMNKCAESDYNDERARSIEFLNEQLQLLSVNKFGRHFSPELTILAYLIHATSASAYDVLLEHSTLSLPSVSTLKKITRRLNATDGLDNSAYLTLRASKLNEQERTVILIIDEIYVAKRVEYSAGQLVGLTPDGDVASTLLCFAVKSLACKYVDIVAIYPMAKLTAQKLNECFQDVRRFLSNISLNVIAVSVDNASTNRKFYTDYVCDGQLKTHVVDAATGQPLFLIIDPVHTLKNIYNNFQSRKVFQCPALDKELPNGCTADFRHIVELYNYEECMSLKKAHQLRPAALQPKSIEKTSVKLAVSIFCESTRDALYFYADQENKTSWRGTADFINLILKLWNVLNVKTCTKGKHKRNSSMDPIRTSWDWQLSYLRDISTFIGQWEKSEKPGLTRETFLALRHTCLALTECATHLLEKRAFDVVLLGHMQSDPIESRFGWLRQMSGANYYISMKQVLDSDKKIRAVSLLKFSSISLQEIDSAIQCSEGLNSADNTKSVSDEIAEKLTYGQDFKPSTSDLNIIYYVSGYIARSVSRATKCKACSETLSNLEDLPQMNMEDEIPEAARIFFDMVNRGGLKTPSEFVFMLTVHCWRVYEEMRANSTLMSTFLASENQRTLYFSIMDRATCHQSVFEFGLNNYLCTQGHHLTRLVTDRFFNCVAKNLASSMTNKANPHNQPLSKRRKIDKLCSKSKEG